jgi:NAD(P)-dependent dehydrogenase (short-subunit alcohol dehydrogenase family)
MQADDAGVVVITGVTRGLGAAMVPEFTARGWTVAGCGTRKTELAELRKQFGEPHLFSAIDVADSRAVDEWAQDILKTLGSPRLLLNNAGVINKNAPLWKVSAEEFERVLKVNILGTANTIRAFLPAMLKSGRGVIVNFSSYWGRSGAAEVGPYCASKFAIEGLTQSLAEELPKGLAAVALVPGIIDTAMLRSCFGAEAGNYHAPKDWAEKAVPYLLKLGPKQNGQALSVPGD